MALLTVGPTFDQAKNKIKENFVVNIGDSEFGNLVVRWRERDIGHQIFHKNWGFSSKQIISFSTLHFVKILMLKFENLKHREETNPRKIRENDVGDKKKC